MMRAGTIPLEDAVRNGNNTLNSNTDDNPHLRSTQNVKGYYIKATDGKIGDVDDFIISDDTWKIDFIVVDTGNWLPGKKVLISPEWIKEISWEDSSVTVNASTKSIKNSPEYDSDKPLTEAYETTLRKHYNQIIYVA